MESFQRRGDVVELSQATHDASNSILNPLLVQVMGLQKLAAQF